MRRLSPFLLGFILFACSMPLATALPQSPPVIVPFKQTLINRTGDSIPVYGTFQFALNIDSVYVKRAPAETIKVAAARGFFPFGAYHVPLDSLGALGYSAAILTVYPPNLKATLEQARALHAHLVLAVDRGKTKDAAGHLSVAATQAEIQRIKATVDLDPYFRDSTVIGIYLFDDLAAASWGGEEPPKPRIDSLALATKAVWPSAITMVRVAPTALASPYTWRWLDNAWAQYNGPYRDGLPDAYRDKQVASAKAQHLGVLFSLNYLDGGCGPVAAACVPGVPGTGVLGTFVNAANVRRFQMSAAEALYYGLHFLAEPYNCGLISWQWSPVWNGTGRTPEQVAGVQAFDRRPDVRASIRMLGSLAALRSGTSCAQR